MFLFFTDNMELLNNDIYVMMSHILMQGDRTPIYSIRPPTYIYLTPIGSIVWAIGC